MSSKLSKIRELYEGASRAQKVGIRAYFRMIEAGTIDPPPTLGEMMNALRRAKASIPNIPGRIRG